jgi:hypothetical protein
MDIRVVFAWIVFYYVGIFATVQYMKPADRKPFKLRGVAVIHSMISLTYQPSPSPYPPINDYLCKLSLIAQLLAVGLPRPFVALI